MTLGQVDKAAAKMKIGDERTFTLDKVPERYQVARLSARLLHKTKKAYSITRSEKTLYIICRKSD